MTKPSFDQHIWKYIFGRPSNLSGQDHLVIHSSEKSVQLILEMCNAPVGIWGISPSNHLDSLELVARFRSWSREEYQHLVPSLGCRSKAENLRAIIPQSATDESLITLRNASHNGWVTFENSWDTLLDQLPSLGWFYVPLWDEVPLSVFCTTVSGMRSIVERHFLLNTMPFSKVSLSRHEETIDFGSELISLCGLQVAAQTWAENLQDE